MADGPERLAIIKAIPIGKGLDAFRASFESVCNVASIPSNLDALERLSRKDLGRLARDVVIELFRLEASTSLLADGSFEDLFDELLPLPAAVLSADFDLNSVKPLLRAALDANTPDAIVWAQAHGIVPPTAPPPLSVPSLIRTQQWSGTSRSVNSTQYGWEVNRVVSDELGGTLVGLCRLRETCFKGVAGLEAASEVVFNTCTEGSSPLFGGQGWTGWPAGAKEREVLAWFCRLVPKVEALAKLAGFRSPYRRRLSETPLVGSTARRSGADIAFLNRGLVRGRKARTHGRHFGYGWAHVLVPGRLMSDPAADVGKAAWIDLATYAVAVLRKTEARRFVLGFTLCGSLMRIWLFDRLGAVASDQFDINKDGLQFVSAILGFIWADETDLGFDPTFTTADGRRFIEIERNGAKERLVVDEILTRPSRLVGRGTTCWKVHREGDPHARPLVVKDSWQDPERDEDGELLREATGKGLVNVSRYYHHETVQVGGADDDVLGNVRKGLDVTKSSSYRPVAPSPRPTTSQSGDATGGEEPSDGVFVLPPLPSACRPRPLDLASPPTAPQNRVRRRIVLCDYGRPIYEASSRVAFLAALEGCIRGHESLYEAGFLHRDVSINNLMINEDENNPSWPSFLIDLDFAIKEEDALANETTGTWVFMACDVLLGERHTFMHDLESFFWVLYWMCSHFTGPGQYTPNDEFDSWYHTDARSLGRQKFGLAIHGGCFLKILEEESTSYWRPLVPWLNKLREKVFPNGNAIHKSLDRGLYSAMRTILREAQEDPEIIRETQVDPEAHGETPEAGTDGRLE